jgi:protein-disulfide isomerase
MIAASCAILWVLVSGRSGARVERKPIAIPEAALSFDAAPVLGSSNAKVAMFVFSDFECPFCETFAQQTWPALRREYVATGLVKVVFRHLPLTTIHRNARRAAEASVCAQRLGKFWEFHDQLFAAAPDLSDAGLIRQARAVGLDRAGFESCLAAPPAEALANDLQLAGKLGIESTPAFLVGTLEGDTMMRARAVVRGARPIEEFRSTIEPLLNR